MRCVSCIVALACAALIGCGSGDPSPSTGVADESGPSPRPEFLGGGARISRCPRAVGIPEAGPCTMAYEDVPMRKCPSGGPGGGDVRAAGVPCALARRLRLPVGAGGWGESDESVHGDVQENVYRPWLADGSYQDPKPTRAIGWTCFKSFDPNGAWGFQHICWDGEGGIVMFTRF